MSIIVYQKFFPVGKAFDLSGFLQILDNEDFLPFILIAEKISDWQYRFYFKHINEGSLIPTSGQRRGNIADEILLREFIVEWLQEDIRITATINSTTLFVPGLFVAIFSTIAILIHSIFALLLAVFIVGAQLLKFYWDIKRFNRIGQIANQSSST